VISRIIRSAALVTSAVGVSLAAGPTGAPVAFASGAFPQVLVGEWFNQWGDCANECLNINRGFQFDAAGGYLYGEEHRTTSNEGGLSIGCIDDTKYLEQGAATADGTSLVTNPSSARATHTNNCHPEQDFDRPVSASQSQYQWQVLQIAGGGMQLKVSAGNNSLVYTRQGNAPPPPPPGPSRAFQTLAAPQRLADTRATGHPIATGTSSCFDVAGQKGIPADAFGVILNVAATGYTSPGWATVYPSGQTVPATSTLNFDPSAYAIANDTIARIGPDGKVCVNVGTANSAPGGAQIVLDATGYLPRGVTGEGSLLTQPQRLVDTRGGDGGRIASGSSSCFTVAGQKGIPSDARGVILNVAATSYTARGWLSLYPAGESVPATSTLNFDPDAYAIANGTIARIGTNGQVCVNIGTVNSAPGGSDVVLDAVGYLSSSANPQVALLPQPKRVVDTRSSGQPIGSGASVCFNVAGQQGIPSGATGLVLNVASTAYSTLGWVSLFPAGQAVPGTSTLDFDPSAYAISNGTIERIGNGGQVCVNVGTVNQVPGDAQVVLDVVGYLN